MAIRKNSPVAVIVWPNRVEVTQVVHSSLKAKAEALGARYYLVQVQGNEPVQLREYDDRILAHNQNKVA